MDFTPYIEKFFKAFSIRIIQYLLFAAIPYLVFYVLFRSRTFRMKIQQTFPKTKDSRREIFYSLSTILIFSVVIAYLFYLRRHGYTKMYVDIGQYSASYFVFSVFMMIILHDTWFYWTHRFMHWNKIFRYVHLIHHKSYNPTPWSVLSFHPLEALIQFAYILVVVMVFPLHSVAILIWSIYQFTLNMIGHLGFELYPKGFARSKLTFWHNTSTHHNMHHKYFNCNYSLYFNIWDRIMGTNHERYTEEFEAVCERRG